MKLKRYEAPTIESVTFEKEDIIRTSGEFTLMAQTATDTQADMSQGTAASDFFN